VSKIVPARKSKRLSDPVENGFEIIHCDDQY